ncbi:MAG: DUF123 domain-containing protein [Halobellus sp.]|uniref:GIY-YIG nuclease family protein n=1 Tax=Halobellus sp. TaxID=1979212 RepID=UPI0035D527EE
MASDADGRAGRLVEIDPANVASEDDSLGIGAGSAPPGTYVLLLSLPEATTLSVGALGTTSLPAGAYAYVGSAFGSNGLARVDRHRRVAAGEHGVTHWHIDYLGGHPSTSLVGVVAAPHAAVECRLASALRSNADRLEPSPIGGFGASDCDCPAHLFTASGVETLGSGVATEFERIVDDAAE